MTRHHHRHPRRHPRRVEAARWAVHPFHHIAAGGAEGPGAHVPGQVVGLHAGEHRRGGRVHHATEEGLLGGDRDGRPLLLLALRLLIRHQPVAFGLVLLLWRERRRWRRLLRLPLSPLASRQLGLFDEGVDGTARAGRSATPTRRSPRLHASLSSPRRSASWLYASLSSHLSCLGRTHRSVVGCCPNFSAFGS